MANIRVKDLPNTSAPAADTDEFIIDSNSAGTRRLNYGELKTAISGDFQSGTTTYKVATLGSDNKLDPAQIPDTLSQGLNFVGVANSAGDLTSTTQGDFYVIQTAFGSYNVGDQAVYDGSAYIRVTDGTKEISEGGTGATTLDAAKVNLEIIDIGTAPNQCPTMGMLGSMSVQDADSVSMGQAEIESTTGTATTQALTVTDGTDNNFVVQEDGKAVTQSTFKSETATNNTEYAANYLRATGGAYYVDNYTVGGSTNFRVSNASAIDTQAVTIDSSGRVGIGTSSPSAGAVGGKVVHVQTSGETASVRVDRSDASTAGTLSLTAGNSTLGVYGTGSKPIAFSVNGSEVARLDDAGRLGVGQAAMGSYNSNANNLVVGSGSGNEGMSIASGASSEGGIYFANGTTGTDQYNGALLYRHNINRLDIFTNGAARWYVDSTGNLIAAAAGQGIDFGSGSSTTLDSYEEGTWNGVYAPQTGTFTTMTMDTDLVYTKVGNLVHVSGFIRTDDVDITGGSNGLKITGLPFTCAKPSAVSVGFAWNWGTAAPLVGYIGASGDAIWLQTRTGTTARTDGFNVSNMSTGTSADRNILYLEATYTTT